MPDHPDLLERDQELAAINAAIEAALSGRGRLTAIVAGAGLGKTRILAEASRAAAAAGFDVFGARATELEKDFAFGLVRQLYEVALTRLDPAEREELLAGPAQNATPALLESGAGSAPGDFAILHGLFWLTSNLCDRRPVALVLDDLHLADTASLRFLGYLLPRLEGLPITLTVALRPDEQFAVPHLVHQVVGAPECKALRLAPLSERGSRELVQGLMSADAEPEFLTACHSATGGNPLLLHALAAAFRAEGLTPTIDNVGLVDVVGPRAVAQRVSLWLSRLPGECEQLARAVAVLGDGSSISHAAQLARLPIEDAIRAVGALERENLFLNDHTNGDDAVQRIRFSHPLVRSTVYQGMDAGERVVEHRRAAELLEEWQSGAEMVAAHLLRIPPARDHHVVDVLRHAAADALNRGSPDTAATHLQRCLAEPPADEVRAEVQWELGQMLALVDTDAAARSLYIALDLAKDRAHTAEVAVLLSTTLIYLLRLEDAEKVCLDALARLPEEEVDLRGKLEANLLLIPLFEPDRLDLADRRHRVRSISGHPSLGGRALDCLLGAHDAWRTDADSVELARQGLRGGDLVGEVYLKTPAAPAAWFVLINSDQDEVLSSIEVALAQAHVYSSLGGLTTVLTLRGIAWLWRGQLTEAETDFRAAMRSADAARFELGQLMCHTFLAETFIDQGWLDEAQAKLDALNLPDPLPPNGPLYWYMDCRTRLLRRQGLLVKALDLALATGRRFARHGANNPAFLAWRSEAALCAHGLGSPEQAWSLANEDLELARQWASPRALGRALRVSGIIQGGASGLERLRESVYVLEPSVARLEYAQSLFELGSALRRAGSRVEARQPLSDAVAVAGTCGALGLATRARAELRATGVRPRQVGPGGLRALTPSERRVAELAAVGESNRHIAEQLFVTVKTVELHLTNVYRKLGVNRREALSEALSDGEET